MLWLVLAGLACGAMVGCTKPVPAVPRFVDVFEQRTGACRVLVIRDTRSAACFAMFRCFRQPMTVIAVDAATCIP
jgi:hypothetical protein